MVNSLIDFNENYKKNKELTDIGMLNNVPEKLRTPPIKLIGTPFMGASSCRQDQLFFVSKRYIEKLYTDWLTVKRNCDVRMKFLPCKECPGKDLHILVQGLREHLENTIKTNWKELDKDVEKFLDVVEDIHMMSFSAISAKQAERDKCKYCQFKCYSQLLLDFIYDFQEANKIPY